MEPLYENIKRIRKEKHITQNELARKTGYASNAMISHIESGEVDLNYSAIQVIASALDVSVTELVSSESANLERRLAALSPKWKEHVINHIEYAEYMNEQDKTS